MFRSSAVPLFVLAWIGTSASAQERVPDFAREIRPLLSDRCFACHGPDAQTREAGLRLDSKDDAFRHRGWRPAPIAPGSPEGSGIVRRMKAESAEERMPPPESGKSLSAEEIAKIERWIAAGAPWEEHWSFVPPRAVELPSVRSEAWVRDPVDRFVLARLEAEGLAPATPADPRALLRRVHLDLTGLPPTPEELAAFEADPSDAAYAAAVDRLLGSTRHAEHQARLWLDAARYGDTHGLHLDNYREMWPYRDWVIGAFEANLPYDRFGIEQLAGDLLSDPTLAQQVATGFNRCHVSTNEGGSIEEEVRVRNVVDRTSTFGTVFLGVTMGCAVCHDHKFDPFSMRDFYALSAFFSNVDGPPMDGNRKDPPPVVRVPDAEQARRERELRTALAELDARVEEEIASYRHFEPDPSALAEQPRRSVTWFDDAFPAGTRVEGDAGWSWEGAEAPVRAGLRSLHVGASGTGEAELRFADAATRLRIGHGDVLYAWVRLDPDRPPEALLVEFNSDGAGAWSAGGYWSAGEEAAWSSRPGGRVRLGALSAGGGWTRLVLPAAELGLRPGQVVHGFGLRLRGGTLVLDEVGIETALRQAPGERLWVDDALPLGAVAQGDAPIWNWVSGPDQPVKHGTRSVRRGGRPGLNQDFFTGAKEPLALHAGDRLFAWAWLDADDPPRSIQLQFHDGGGWDHRVRWGAEAHGPGRPNGADHRAGDLPPLGRWVRLEVGLAEVGLAPGSAVNGMAFTQVGGTVWWDGAGVRTWHLPDTWPKRSLSAWLAVASADAALPGPLRERAKRPLGEDEASRALERYWLRNVCEGIRPRLDPLTNAQERERARLEELMASVPTTLVMAERGAQRPTHILQRGQYDHPGELVERNTPLSLPPMDASWSRDRLGLARWVFDSRNPLAARVQVNRLWQQVFGAGLVRTSEDFGSQGSPPSHPELLDWLAVRFAEEGWDMRGLLRRLVLSSTYRQAASVDERLLRLDPENHLLARSSRHRLDAEVLRDQALFAAGLLFERRGGPSVKPPQPDGLWKAVGYSSSNTVRFQADRGHEKVHRRTMYTFLKRTAPAPQLSTFDAPNRETCVVRRERTNTPLQALLLLNDPQFVEAARALGQRVLAGPSGSDEERAAALFELATARRPDAFERACLLDLLRVERSRFGADPRAARALLGVGETPRVRGLDEVEVAAWTTVANLVLNLDEVLVRP